MKTRLNTGNPRRTRAMKTKKVLYWLIAGGGYWLEDGGVDPRQSKGERFSTRELARETRDKWCDFNAGEKAHLVRVVARGRK